MVGVKGRTGVKPPDVVKGRDLHVRITGAQMEIIKRISEITGVNASTLVRALIEYGLNMAGEESALIRQIRDLQGDHHEKP